MTEPTSTEEAELSVLGSILMTGGKALEEITLTPDDFASPRNARAFELMQRMWAQGQAVDLVSAGSALATADAETKRLVTPVYLAKAMHDTPTSALIGQYQQITREHGIRRRLINATTAITLAVNEVGDINQVIEVARKAIDDAGNINTTEIRSMADTEADTIRELNEPPRFTPTPWADLNHLIGGWRPGALYVIGARPGSGKTLVGLQSAVNMLGRGAVLMCTLEMGENEIHKRVFSQLLHIPLSNILDSNMTPNEWERLTKRKATNRDRFYVDDNPAQTVEGIRRQARTIHRRTPLSMIVVDYLQLMESTGKSDKKRHEEIARWTRALKVMAKTFDVPVLVLSQLNRESARGGKPTLADLRESGAIEQDADVVLLLHREDDVKDELNMLVAKNRHGMREAITLQWEGHFASVSDRQWHPAIEAA